MNWIAVTGPVVMAREAPGAHFPAGHPLSTSKPVMTAELSDQVTLMAYWPAAVATTPAGTVGGVAAGGCDALVGD